MPSFSISTLYLKSLGHALYGIIIFLTDNVRKSPTHTMKALCSLFWDGKKDFEETYVTPDVTVQHSRL